MSDNPSALPVWVKRITFDKYVGGTILLVLFSLLWFRQFDSPDGDSSLLYANVLGGLRWIDLVIGTIIGFHLLLLIMNGSKRIHVPRELWRPAALFFCATVFAIVQGWSKGGTHVFFDWREICIGCGLIVVFGYWIKTPEDLQSAARLFACVFAGRVLFILMMYLAGGGVETVLEGIRTPFYDGATLSIAGFLGVLSVRAWQQESTFGQKLFWLWCGFLAYLLVLTSFRRTFWGELAIATIVLLLLNRRGRKKTIFVVAVAVVVVASFAARNVSQRLQSFSFDDTDLEYAETNLDHINDVLDAWDQIADHPILGIGLGRSYETFRIAAWKTESTVVHNAPLHVWLFYGLAGLLAYLWFHFNLFRWLAQFKDNFDPRLTSFAQASLAYMSAQFVMRCGFSPWQYGGLQENIVFAFLLGGLLSLYSNRDVPAQ